MAPIQYDVTITDLSQPIPSEILRNNNDKNNNNNALGVGQFEAIAITIPIPIAFRMQIGNDREREVTGGGEGLQEEYKNTCWMRKYY